MALKEIKNRTAAAAAAAVQPAQPTQQTPRINPEIDAQLDRFIASNTKLYEHYLAQPKERLARKLMLGRMQKEQIAEKSHQRLLNWAQQDPKLMARIAEVKQRQLPGPKERATVSNIITASMRQQALSQIPAQGPRV